MKSFRIIFLSVFTFSSAFVRAQTSTTTASQRTIDPHNIRKGLVPMGVKAVINGRVFTTKEGEINIPGVEVKIKGTKLSTITNSGGTFHFDISTLIDSKDDLTLIFESKNYSIVDTTVKKPDRIVIRL